MRSDTEHLDEGTIHAWLDDAMPAADAAGAERHVDACPLCAARVAEARGLIAGASRVLSQLDDTPAPLLRPAAVTPVAEGSLWRALRITPARASIAALLIVAVGVTLTQRQTAPRQESTLAADSASPLAGQDLAAPGAPQPAPTAQSLARGSSSPREEARLQRPSIGAASGVAVVIPPADSTSRGSSELADGDARSRVAAARKELAIQRDTQGIRADQTVTTSASTGAAAGAPAVAPPLVAAANAAERAGLRQSRSLSVQPGTCYRVERTGGTGNTWGDAPFPMVIAFDSGSVARVLKPTGEDTEARAIVTRLDPDSMSFRLRRIGFTGSMTLGALGTARNGFARSLNATRQPESLSVTARVTSCPAP